MLKVQLNSSQIKLAQGWLDVNCYPYAYNPIKGMLWFWQSTPLGPVKNALKLNPNQLQQLDQLAD
jgi:hypothetical protein